MTDLLDAALRLADEGYRVHPLRPRDKTPVVAAWQTHASADHDQIQRWWTTMPQANIGIATGHGLVVIDLDEGGQAALKRLEMELGELPATRYVLTGSHGEHLYFAVPAGTIIPNSSRSLGPGIDVRGDGGQVVAPPSVHPNGEPYRWMDNGPIADLPLAWITRMQTSGQRDPVRLRELYRNGERNNELFRLAAALRAKGVGVPGILTMLHETNRTACVPPLPAHEIDTIAKSAGKYEAGAGPAPRRTLEIITAADVQPEPIEWLWEGYLPLGKMVILDGDPGLGKSTIWIDIASRMSRARPMPLLGKNGLTGPASTLLIMGEDGVADTIVPRILAAEGDPSLIHIVNPDIIIPDDTQSLADAIERYDAKMLVFDPLTAHLGDKSVDLYNDKAVRQALTPLLQVAAHTNCLIACNRHLSKDSKKKAVARGMGSMGISAVSRHQMVVGKEKRGDCNVLASGKINIGQSPPSLRYQLVSHILPDGVQTSRVAWIDVSSITADELVTEDDD